MWTVIVGTIQIFFLRFMYPIWLKILPLLRRAHFVHTVVIPPLSNNGDFDLVLMLTLLSGIYKSNIFSLTHTHILYLSHWFSSLLLSSSWEHKCYTSTISVLVPFATIDATMLSETILPSVLTFLLLLLLNY